MGLVIFFLYQWYSKLINSYDFWIFTCFPMQFYLILNFHFEREIKLNVGFWYPEKDEWKLYVKWNEELTLLSIIITFNWYHYFYNINILKRFFIYLHWDVCACISPLECFPKTEKTVTYIQSRANSGQSHDYFFT